MFLVRKLKYHLTSERQRRTLAGAQPGRAGCQGPASWAMGSGSISSQASVYLVVKGVKKVGAVFSVFLMGVTLDVNAGEGMMLEGSAPFFRIPEFIS